jgi:hypothetical protein
MAARHRMAEQESWIGGRQRWRRSSDGREGSREQIVGRASGRATRRLVACLAAVVLVASGCGAGRTTSQKIAPAPPPSSSRYSSHFRTTWLRACDAAASGSPTAGARCTCTLSYLEARVAQRTLESTESAVLKGEAKEPDWILNAVATCLKG